MLGLVPPASFKGRFFTNLAVRAAYSEGAGPYRIVPTAVAIPEERADLCTLIRFAADTGVPLTPRGAGSGMPGGNVGEGIVVDLSAFARPARVALAQVANVGAAVTWATVSQVASHFGFRLPPDPSSGAFCTIGGMVATNAAGARSLRFGSIRPWVRGIELATADGECGWIARTHAARTHRKSTPPDRRQLVEDLAVHDRVATVRSAVEHAAPEIAARFPDTPKNTAGYALDQFLATGDVVDLVIGSEGTLGIVTRVELQLALAPDATGTMLLALDSLETLSGVVAAILEHHPVAVELLDRTFLDLARAHAPVDVGNAPAVLIVEFEERSQQRLRDTMQRAERAIGSSCRLTRSGMTSSERETLWSLRHGASPSLAALPAERRSLQVIEDGCVPVAALGRYVRGVGDAARDAGVAIVAFGHAGDGHLHVNALVDTTQPDFERRLEQLLETVTELVVSLGGTTSGEHGDGRLRAGFLERMYGPHITRLFRHVKSAFDPVGVFNPGVIVPAAAPPLSQLKVGPDAAEIPVAIADGLHRIERTGTWDLPRLALLEAEE